MDIIITTIIILGTIVMVQNILWYISFLRNSRDIFSSGTKQEKISHITGLILLIFFFLGYTFIWIFSDPDIMVALILFFGSVFVTIMLYITFTLLDSVKKRSLDIAEVLIGVIDARDPNLNGHSVHVQNLTMLIFKYLPRHLKNKINPISLEYASLMHDIGKPRCKTTDDAGIDHFKKHPAVGAAMAEDILTRLKADNRTKELVCEYIKEHDNRLAENERSVARFISKHGYEFFDNYLLIRRADTLAQSMYYREEKLKDLEVLRDIRNELERKDACLKLSDLAIGGRELLALGLRGREIGIALDAALEGVIAGEVKNEREELIAYVKQKRQQ